MRPGLARFQGAYFALTALWALVDVDSFQAVTGPKTDLWLVKTVALLILVVAAALLSMSRRRPFPPDGRWLGLAAAAALGGVDVVYVLQGTISRIYLLDAALEGALVVAWLAAPQRSSP
jgi:hypothetical protein